MAGKKSPKKSPAQAGALSDQEWLDLLAFESLSFLSVDINELRAFIASGAIPKPEERDQLERELADALAAYRSGDHALAMSQVKVVAHACWGANLVPLAQTGLKHGKASGRGGKEGARLRQQKAAKWHREAEKKARALLATGRAPHEVTGLIAGRDGLPKADAIRRHLKKEGLI